jgi:hypothetical protein
LCGLALDRVVRNDLAFCAYEPAGQATQDIVEQQLRRNYRGAWQGPIHRFAHRPLAKVFWARTLSEYEIAAKEQPIAEKNGDGPHAAKMWSDN